MISNFTPARSVKRALHLLPLPIIIILLSLTSGMLGGCQLESTTMRLGASEQPRHIVNRAHKSDRLFMGVLADVEPVRVSGRSRTSFYVPASHETVFDLDFATGAVPRSRKPNQFHALSRFYMALDGLERDAGNGAVSILHLGDSHIAGDRISGDLRAKFQARFGDGGRGLLMPPGGFRYYHARGVRFEREGVWTSRNVLRDKSGYFGLTGVRLTSGRKGSAMRAMSDRRFEAVEIVFRTGPTFGMARIEVGGVRKVVDCHAPVPGFERISIAAPGSVLEIFQHGRAPISILSLEMKNTGPGLRYVNFGIPGATIRSLERLNDGLWRNELRHLDPNLVVLGFGTNEAFNDRLDIAAYGRRLQAVIERIRNTVPEASLLIMGPPDLARMPKYAGLAQRRSGSAACQRLDGEERKSYFTKVAARDASLLRWFGPLKLEAVRRVLSDVAQRNGAYFWDWSTIMGGDCGVHVWVHSKPKLAANDHVHLTAAGYRRTAEALFGQMMANYQAFRDVVISRR